MENERIKEVLIELIDILGSTNNHKLFNDLELLKNKLNQPEEPQDNGKFAEVVKETEFTIKSGGSDFHDVSKFYEETKLSDKELLKEAADLLSEIYTKGYFYRYENGMRTVDAKLINEFLTKLNKHLNHE